MKNVEIEYKLDANTPRAFEKVRRFLKSFVHVAGTDLHIQDVYLDHANNDLSKQKIALRLRNTDGKWEATFKTRTEIKQGKAVRREETLPLVHAHNLPQALAQLGAKRTWKGLRVTELIPRFVIKNKRTIYDVIYQKSKLEISLDRVTILAAGRQLKMKEIEIELKAGLPVMLDQFVQVLMQHTKLKRTINSKVKTAQCLLDLIEK